MKKLSSVTISGGLTVDQATTLSGVVSVGGIGTGAYTSVLVRNSSNQMLYRNYSDFVNDISGSLNLSGYVPTSRTLTINGTTYDLSADRTWTISTVDYTSRLQHQVKAGVAINKGQAVYVTSADGTNMIVGLASNASEATSSKTMGLLDATVTTNGFANVVTEGLLAGLDTSTAGAEGDPVWLGTGGNLIYGLANKPYAPAHLVFIGIVTRKNANNGEIFVKVQNGFELKEIHDVDLITTVPVNGHILGYNGTLWVNKTIAGWLGYTPANASGTTNYISKFTGSTTLGNSQIFDNGTNVGIGTTSPTHKLTVTGDGSGTMKVGGPGVSGNYTGISLNGTLDVSNYNILSSPTDNHLYINRPTGNDIYFRVNNNDQVIINSSGNVGIGTSSPGYKLDVTGASSDWATRFASNAGASAYFANGAGYGAYIDAGSNATSSTYLMSLVSNGSTRVYVRGDGNVGIGTTSPGYKLHVAGDILSSGSFRLEGGGASVTYISEGWGINLNGDGTHPVQIPGSSLSVGYTLGGGVNYGSGNAYISGSVGIGTNNPGYKLDIIGVTRFQDRVRFAINLWNLSDDGYNRLYFANGGRTYYGSGDGHEWRSAADTSIGFLTNAGNLILKGTNAFTTGGTATLSVIGDIISLGSSNNDLAYFRRSGTGQFQWQTYNSGNNGEIHLQPYGGNVGIGTTAPSKKLHIYESGAKDAELLITSTYADGYDAQITLENTHTGGRIYELLSTNDSRGIIGGGKFAINDKTAGDSVARLVIDSSGNIGIGTTSPAARLHVVGNTYIESGNLYVNTIAGYSTNLVSIAASTNVLVPSGDITIGSGTSTSTTQPFGDFSQLKFDNLHSDTNRGPNKIVMHDNGGSWIGGFGIHSDTVSYYTGGHHRWYKTDSQTSSSQVMQLDPSGNLTLAGTLSASGYNKSNWDTAYGWGNHASAGYLTSYSETDTLASVTGRGASTSTAVTFNGGVNLAADTGIRKAGDNWIIGYSTSLPGIAIGSGTVTDKVSISSGGTQRVWFDTNGNVGIGTASPNYKLDVNGFINIFSGNGLRWGSGDAEIINSGWNLLFRTYNGSVLSEAMRINSAGKVSIGTTDTNSDKSDFTVYTGSGASIALVDDQVRMGGTDVNWGLALRSTGTLQTYGQNLYLNTVAGNYPVIMQPNGTSSVEFYSDYTLFNGLNLAISRTNSTHGATNYFRGDASHLVIGTGGTLYLNYGGSTTIVTGNATVSGYVGVTGIVSANARKLSLGILDLNTSGTPGQFKIKTSIPWNYGGSDFTVNIKGFRYGSSQMVSLSIGWHFYNNEFYSRNAICNGAWAPTITLAKSPDGYVIIHLPSPNYWAKLYVESVYSSNSADSYTSGWSWSDADLSDCTLIQTVPYKDLATNISGNAATATFATTAGALSSMNISQFTNNSGYITSYTETDTLQSVTSRGSSTNTTLTSTAQLGLYVNSGSASYIGVNSTSNWAYVSLLNNGSTTWDIGAYNGGALEFRPYGNGNNAMYLNLDGSLFINSLNDGKLNLRVPSGDSSDWNYINFIGSNGVRDTYFGTDSGGTPTWWRDDNGVNITLSSSVLINGNTAWHAGNLTNLNQLTNGPGYITSSALSGYATTSYVTTQINNLINGAPGALDTLSELASALGNDASFATTVTNSIAGKVSKGGDTITTSNQYGLVIDHSPVLGDFVDALLVRSTTSGQRAQIGFATVDADGDHHRASIRAYKGAGTLEGVFGIALRQAGSGAHVQRLTLDYLGNLTIGGALTESSSFKLKENVQTSEGNLEKVVNLRPVTYNKIGSQTKELGLIAEEVAEVYPEFVQYDENGEPVGVHYSRLTAALIGAVKELTNQVQELNKKING